MTIKTLEYIHNLLLNDERTTSGMLKFSRENEIKAQKAYDENQSEKNKKLLEKAQEDHHTLYEKYRISSYALEEFESHEF